VTGTKADDLTTAQLQPTVATAIDRWSILSDSYRPLDNLEVAEAIRLQQKERAHQLEVDVALEAILWVFARVGLLDQRTKQVRLAPGWQFAGLVGLDSSRDLPS
jgi:hypothetical protein